MNAAQKKIRVSTNLAKSEILLILKVPFASNKILEWQEKEVEIIAYNVGISFLKAIINGDNDHLFFYLDKK